MNLFKTFLFLSITCLFQSCQTPEEETKQIVNRFLLDINNPQGSTFNKNDVTDEFGKYLFDNRTYNLEDWNFITGVDSDSIIFVQASSNSLTQEFRLAKRQGTWKISDSKNLIATNYDIELVEKKWADYSYLSQVAILKDLREHLQLKVIVPGYEAFLGKSRKGQLRIVNNSNHDVKNVRVLIEHFDINGISVNNDEEYILYPIRKGGYRDVNWYSTDCENCERQEFTIHFTNEVP